MNKNRIVGEPFVWFTSMGLAFGLVMVACLLYVITLNGVEVFWPDRITQVTLKPGSPAALHDSLSIGGAIVQKREKIGQVGSEEWQIYLGNKDAFGQTFLYFDRTDVQSIAYPKNAFRIERMEYGDAIGFPESLQLIDGKTIPATDASFDKKMSELVEQAQDRRDEIKEIEKVKIGAINREMERSQMDEIRLKRKGSSQESQIKDLLDRRRVLQVDYELLAAKAQSLRAKQDENHLSYKLFSGEEQSIPVGDVVSYYYPNRITTVQRLGLFFEHLWTFLSDEPRESNTEGGIFPAIFGTFVMTLLLSLAVTPFGVLAAIYLREYAKQGIFVRSVRIAVNNLAGVPSIVFGVFGLGFFVYLLGGSIDQLFFKDYLPTPTFGTGGILWASLTLALMTVPVVIVATEESLAAVPRGVREGSLACGASKWQTIRRVVLPASAPGILTGLILAMSRGAGEVAPLMLVGVVKLAPSLPLDSIYPYFHLDQKFMHLGFHIYDLGFQSPDSEAAKPMVFATTFFLILLVVLLNLGAILIRERLRRKYATGAF